MKARFAILTLVATAIGFAFAVPELRAMPPSKTVGMIYVKKKNAQKRKNVAAMTPAKQRRTNTIGLFVKDQTRGKGASRRSYRGFRKGR